jgi:DNA (cytosine-5)-methyltransferase 1
MKKYTTLELCAGGGGQAIGLEKAGFESLACVEYEPNFCKTLVFNRPSWNVICQDLRELDGSEFAGCDLLAGGVPCPPFSIAGQQLGENDERDMFPSVLKLVERVKPRGIMLENVKGLMSKKFEDYRTRIVKKLEEHGYKVSFRVLEASDYGVPQLRPRFILVALNNEDMDNFSWPKALKAKKTVGEALYDLLYEHKWEGAENIRSKACTVAPTLVGGSKKHGGPDLGPTRAKAQWKELGIDGMGIAADAPDKDFPVDSMPRLTIRMAARIQGFPDSWKFYGSKTTQYRQIGNAFPPPVAYAVGRQIMLAFRSTDND